MIHIIIWENLKNYRPQESSFDTFIGVKIFTGLVQLLKKSQRQKRKDPNVKNLSLHFEFKDGECLLDSIKSKNITNYEDIEEFNYLHKQLCFLLTNKEKKVYRHYLQSYTPKEISIRLKCNKRSVDNALSRIRAKAKKIYREYND